MPKPVNYSGSWTLDRSRSTGLPSYYERVRSHRLEIDQRGWRLDVAVSVDIGGAASDTMRFVYAMDGKETRAQTPVRGPNGMTPVPTVMHATVSRDRQVHVTIERDIAMNGSSFHAVTKEDWLLSADGGMLTIHRTDDTPRGTMQSDLVFARNAR
ncbi:MAG TPA: hypothetical protein VF761_12060 [Gemmatimonadaceae bacterium]